MDIANRSIFVAEVRKRLWRALEIWCCGLGTSLHPAGEGLRSLTPLPSRGEIAYDAVAADQFAAAASGYWLRRANASDSISTPLRELIRFALVSHVAVQDRPLPDGAVWGATAKPSNNDWHAPLFPAATGILLEGALSRKEEAWLRQTIEWEAGFHVQNPPDMEGKPPLFGRKSPGRHPAHSCGESLAWTAALLQVARVRYPDANGATFWREAAIIHALNSTSFPEDVTSSKCVAGRSLAERVVGANFEPGGIQEHHGFFHPGYMAWPLASLAVAFLLDQRLPPEERDPEAYLHHWQDVFARLKQCCLDNGRLIYAAGFDWNQYGYGNTRLLPAALFAAAHYMDRQAARLADQYLTLMEFQQARSGWAFQIERMATQRQLYPNRYAWYEAIDGMAIAESLWILDEFERVDSALLVEPDAAEKYQSSTAGTYVEPRAQLAWHRTNRVFASFSWRAYPSGAQALVQPLHNPHLLKWNAGAAGILEFTDAAQIQALEWCQTQSFDEGGFYTIGQIVHGRWEDQRNVRPLARQILAMVALPKGLVLWIDRYQAMQNCEIETNLSFPVRLAADIFNGCAARLAVDGKELEYPQHPAVDTWHLLRGRQLTAGQSLTLTNLQGDGSFHLMQKRRRDPKGLTMLYGEGSAACEESLVSHDLYFGSREPRLVASGEWIRKIIHALTCETEERENPEDIRIVGDDPFVFGIVTHKGDKILLNLSDKAGEVLGERIRRRQIRFSHHERR